MDVYFDSLLNFFNRDSPYQYICDKKHTKPSNDRKKSPYGYKIIYNEFKYTNLLLKDLKYRLSILKGVYFTLIICLFYNQ